MFQNIVDFHQLNGFVILDTHQLFFPFLTFVFQIYGGILNDENNFYPFTWMLKRN